MSYKVTLYYIQSLKPILLSALFSQHILESQKQKTVIWFDCHVSKCKLLYTCYSFSSKTNKTHIFGKISLAVLADMYIQYLIIAIPYNFRCMVTGCPIVDTLYKFEQTCIH